MTRIFSKIGITVEVYHQEPAFGGNEYLDLETSRQDFGAFASVASPPRSRLYVRRSEDRNVAGSSARQRALSRLTGSFNR